MDHRNKKTASHFQWEAVSNQYYETFLKLSGLLQSFEFYCKVAHNLSLPNNLYTTCN